MQRLLFRLLFAVTGLVAIAAFVGYQLLEGSLPTLDGEIVAPGLEAPASLERDAAGVPTLSASNRRDLAFATGFAHGQDRFFQMDLTRRKAAGELAALVGPVAVPLDRRYRLHRFRSRAAEALSSLPAPDARLLEAYARGVNAAVDEVVVRPFEYVVLRTSPEPWRAEDSLLVLYAMFFELNDERAAGEIGRGFAERALPPGVYDWLYPEGTRWDAPLTGGEHGMAPLPGPDAYDLRDIPAVDGETSSADAARMPGSNNWAVAGELTHDGRALVANDMHLGLTTPNVFYRARLVVEGERPIDVSGVTLPGTPVVVAGSNGRVAWGFTNSYGDWSDAVVLRPGLGAETYVSPEGERRFVEYRETIEVKGGDDVDLLVRETVWGPVHDAVDVDGLELAIAWTAHHAAAVNLEQLELETARSVEEALAVANASGIPPQNFVCGDADGNIGWTIAGRIPLRRDYDASLPADFSTDGGGWSGWLEPDRYPRIVNPPGGRLWTANARVADGETLGMIGDGGYALGARARQIRDGLEARERFRPDDMLAIQLDDRALFLEPWRNLLLDLLGDRALEGRPGRAAFRRHVESWIPRAAAGSVGYRLVREFHTDVRDTTFAMLMTPVKRDYGRDVPLHRSAQFDGPLWTLVTERPPHLLTSDHESWRELLLDAVDRIVAHATRDGAELGDYRWGARNTAAIRHPLSAGLPMVSRWLDMPRDELAGDFNMPRVQSPSFGASERFAVSPGNEAAGYLHMPAGQSGHPLSPFYEAGHAAWVTGEPTPFLPGAVRHRLTLLPAR